MLDTSCKSEATAGCIVLTRPDEGITVDDPPVLEPHTTLQPMLHFTCGTHNSAAGKALIHKQISKSLSDLSSCCVAQRRSQTGIRAVYRLAGTMICCSVCLPSTGVTLFARRAATNASLSVDTLAKAFWARECVGISSGGNLHMPHSELALCKQDLCCRGRHQQPC